MFDISYETITFTLGCVGSLLGVMNTWRSLSKERVRLKVIPKRVVTAGNFPYRVNISVDVINFSSFPLTITEIGFSIQGSDKRGVLIKPMTSDARELPVRLDSRESLTVYGIIEGAYNYKNAYALTACGYKKKGTSPAFKQIVESLNE